MADMRLCTACHPMDVGCCETFGGHHLVAHRAPRVMRRTRMSENNNESDKTGSADFNANGNYKGKASNELEDSQKHDKRHWSEDDNAKKKGRRGRTKI